MVNADASEAGVWEESDLPRGKMAAKDKYTEFRLPNANAYLDKITISSE